MIGKFSYLCIFTAPIAFLLTAYSVLPYPMDVTWVILIRFFCVYDSIYTWLSWNKNIRLGGRILHSLTFYDPHIKPYMKQSRINANEISINDVK